MIGDYFARMWPPKWSFFEAVWKPAVETLYVALWGNVLATIIGLPLGLLAASTVTRSRRSCATAPWASSMSCAAFRS